MYTTFSLLTAEINTCQIFFLHRQNKIIFCDTFYMISSFLQVFCYQWKYYSDSKIVLILHDLTPKLADFSVNVFKRLFKMFTVLDKTCLIYCLSSQIGFQRVSMENLSLWRVPWMRNVESFPILTPSLLTANLSSMASILQILSIMSLGISCSFRRSPVLWQTSSCCRVWM